MAADALSRMQDDWMILHSHQLFLLSKPEPEILHILLRENSSLDDMVVLHQQYKAGKLSAHYTVNAGILLFKQRYYISKCSSLKETLLHEFHATPLAGHVGIKGTLVRLSSCFYWPSMRQDVENWVATCLVCQQIKSSTQAPAGLIQPLPIPDQV